VGQTLKASRALLKHIQVDEKKKQETTGKQSLLAESGEEDEEDQGIDTPIWLQLTTKKHIVDKKRLKPTKIAIPHSLNKSSNASILLITGDQQRTYKDLIASEAFPADLRSRITRIIDNNKIKKKYSQYEAQRQLRDDHDIILADDRIITRLPQLLGKTFYKAAAKRPIPISMQAPAARTDGKRIARAKDVAKDTISPQKLAAEIEKTLNCALVAMSPSTQTSVRVGYASWPAKQIVENIEAVANELITKFVPQKWRGVRGLHIKGPESAALPIWLADELWTDEADVLENVPEDAKPITGTESANVGKKRKAIEEAPEETKKSKKVKAAKLIDSNDNNLDKEIALRKEKLKKQKEEAAASVDVDVPKAVKVKKTKKSKTSSIDV
jgi:ribosome biogenesis protein UTP30